VTSSEENVYYGGRLVGKRLVSVTNSNNGLVSDFTADRLQSKGNGSTYYPYGESKTSTSGDDREGFATYTRDEKSGLDYADQRWYASGVGRFGSVDPAISSAITRQPNSWNRYSYVELDPISRTDANGLGDEKSFCDLYPDHPACSGPSRPGGAPPIEPILPDTDPSDLTRLEKVRGIVRKALESESCSGLFPGGLLVPDRLLGGGDINLMDNIFSGSIYGRINFADLGGVQNGGVTAAVTIPVLLGDPTRPSTFVGANITINSNLSSPWLSGNYPDVYGITANPSQLYAKFGVTDHQDIYRAITLLHELGHAYDLFGANQTRSLIQNDQDRPDISRANSKLVYERCFK